MGIQLIKYPRVSVFQVGHSAFHYYIQWSGGGRMAGMVQDRIRHIDNLLIASCPGSSYSSPRLSSGFPSIPNSMLP